MNADEAGDVHEDRSKSKLLIKKFLVVGDAMRYAPCAKNTSHAVNLVTHFPEI